MTDQNAPNDQTDDQATVKPNAPQKARKTRQKRDAFSVTDLARARLRKRGIKSDERLSDECKVVRGMLRREFAYVSKNDATVRKAKDAPNDRKPWPTNMNATTFALIVNGQKGKNKS